MTHLGSSAGSQIHDDRRTLGGEVFGDRRADAFGRTSHDCALVRQFVRICAHKLYAV